jgi:hypothetical protein
VIKEKDKKFLTTEIQCMRNVNTKVIPVITRQLCHLKIIQKIPEQHTRRAHNIQHGKCYVYHKL